MTNSKSYPLVISRLPCQIPNYKPQISSFLKDKSDDPLYKGFIEKFLAYVPIDYLIGNQIEVFGEFGAESFEFFKHRTVQERKIWLSQGTLQGNPALTVLLLNDDKPFIIDAISCLLAKLGLPAKFILHPLLFCIRDSVGVLKELKEGGNNSEFSAAESLVYIKILGTFDPQTVESIKEKLEHTLEKVDAINSNLPGLLEEVNKLESNLLSNKDNYNKYKVATEEIVNFLDWLKADNFTFLGITKFDVESSAISNIIGDWIWEDSKEQIKTIIGFSSDQMYRDKNIILGKIDNISPINSSHFVDYILIKELDSSGQYKSGIMILGLYSLSISYQSVKTIPILKSKLRGVLEKSNFSSNGYNSKKLKMIIESLPREALIQIEESDLYCMCFHMLSSMMSRKLKLFIQQEVTGSFINVLIFLPRERLTTENHTAINKYLSEKFSSEILSDCITEVAQDFLHLFVTLSVKNVEDFSVEEIESDLNRLSTDWSDAFYQALCANFNEYESGIYFKTFDPVFPADYRQKFNAATAVIDLGYLRMAAKHTKMLFNFTFVNASDFRLKIYSPATKLTLSDILPSIENLSFSAIDEQSFAIKPADGIKESWIYEFILSSEIPIEGDFAKLKYNVEEALDKMMSGLLANDSLSKLTVLSGLSWRQIKLLKAFTRYLHQTILAYDKNYVQLTLIKHYAYTELLIKLFELKFNPDNQAPTPQINEITAQINDYIDKVTNNIEDKILRHMLVLVEAAVRTNYYQKDKDGLAKNYLSFKFSSGKMPGLPRPIPHAEIFVYSNDFEGIHLRGGKVARGGLRWSDRSEDYRIEVLGLMKAQMTKNSVIVPVGAKGGFVLAFDQDQLTPAAYMPKVIDCYKNFLRGLLDITDNITGNDITHPKNTVIYDEKDPYLVVAADKGTATFSDYANEVAAEYEFWLGDAFASGGSKGYDHKKIAITAKGAWISVQRHFEEMGIDVQKDVITVAGIGDMSGDVFGNGMLRSNRIKLVAAFNHKHIFIDPDPDLQTAFNERTRLFALPKSNWSDYNPALISNGGGVFERSSKSITLTSEIKKLLKIQENKVAPEELIRAILKAEVDLIWNGGIGTYIKASTENNFEIGDKANDNLRCDAIDIKAKAIAEGGNLGISQKGRIEYGKKGGRINTDFIDNSAGVDCSDHEVNIKIALNRAVVAGTITATQRDHLLHKMTDQVEELVLVDNYRQTQAITISEYSPALTVEILSQFIDLLEEKKLLDRNVEFLPNKSELTRRAVAREKVTRPELAVLLSYSKMSVYKELADAKITKEDYFEDILVNYFPPLMREQFRQEILSHPLRDDIIRTCLTNEIVNRLGGPIIYTIQRETGGMLCNILRSYIIVCEIFGLDNLWRQAENLPSQVSLTIKVDMFTELAKIMRRGISWFIKHLEHPININKTIDEFIKPTRDLSKIVGSLIFGEAKEKFDARVDNYKAGGIEENFAEAIATLDSLVSVFDIIYIAKETDTLNSDVARIYFAAGNKFSVDWLRKTCEKQMDDSYWNRLSTQSIKDDLYDKQRRLIIKIMQEVKNNDLDAWVKDRREDASIFLDFIEELKLQENVNLDMIILANKKFELFLRNMG